MELSKGEDRRILAEGLILYFVLFFPGIYSSGFPGKIEHNGTIPFSTFMELGRTMTYTVPSLALLWYLISLRKSTGEYSFSSLKLKNLQNNDFLSFIIGLPGIILIGLGVSLLVSLYSHSAPPPKIQAPGSVLGWLVMVFSCLSTGYLEESYFRYYILTAGVATPQPVTRAIFSIILFSLCHLYEGPWGVMNAVLAGSLLSILFLRYRSLHGIAWAHGAYNIFIYSMGNFGA
ncbi:MAG: CPBP family intramembrane metalloprotease [Treponema sp.]|jgi:membrane protease YdiL (CAAX protease family)|nr:CPBP family intramembrane metalloprotease [Treponema sp.]